VSGQQHAPAALYSRERHGTHFTGGWVGMPYPATHYILPKTLQTLTETIFNLLFSKTHGKIISHSEPAF